MEMNNANHLILIAEDDPAISAGLADLLMLEGYEVETAACGRTALEKFRARTPDLVLLDIMMPVMNGYDVCREIRRDDPHTPVLMLTAKSEEIDKVIGLELGADDYIVKPFGTAELLARVRSALRRSAATQPPEEKKTASRTIVLGDVSVDFASMTGCRNGENFSLTPKETALLKFLAENEGQVLSREVLLEEVWGVMCDITTRSVDQHILRLRQKLEDNPASPRFIHTAHGAGYKFARI